MPDSEYKHLCGSTTGAKKTRTKHSLAGPDPTRDYINKISCTVKFAQNNDSLNPVPVYCPTRREPVPR